MAEKTRVKVRRIYLPDGALLTTRVRGIGFQASCSCGWESRALKSVKAARAESKAHHSTHDATERVTLAGPV